ncbi:hypothetical protein M408DRAFT_328554 [Serendipita vermifera MAFF 305830]|uniref:Uncharacterized protein n=1 Tax=Serendipita vermifera MAFF 305830 TaxID=933852 RepID=A0A0C2WU65_SERVB|nr:hypothetical protein M408DRAFT_328554 [Serendipita vermifera MAFF 305830]
MDITVKWGSERFTIPFPDASTPLGTLKATLEERTSIPQTQFKLVHGGAILKDNNAPLSAYKIKPGSTLTLIGSTSSIPSKRETANVPAGPDVRTESGMNAAIQAELQKVEKTITPDLTALLSALSFSPQKAVSEGEESAAESAAVPTADQFTPETLKQTYGRVGELLLQSLLRLDALTPPTEWEETRRARKAAVKQVQASLDALDMAWKGALAAGKLDEGGAARDGTAQANGSAKGKGKGKRRR